MRLRKVQQIAQGHSAGAWWGRESIHEPKVLTTSLNLVLLATPGFSYWGHFIAKELLILVRRDAAMVRLAIRGRGILS